jgi:primosomal replication protein N
VTDTEEGINRLIMTGEVVSDPATRKTPAGISITRFTLQHQSIQQEAGNARKVECRIFVTASGDVYQQSIEKGAQVEVQGFLSYESRQKMETRLIIHAQSIKELKYTD